MIRKLLTKDPAARLTAKDALSHPWIVKHWNQEQAEHHDADSPVLSKALIGNMNGFRKSNEFRKLALEVIAYNLTGKEIQGC